MQEDATLVPCHYAAAAWLPAASTSTLSLPTPPPPPSSKNIKTPQENVAALPPIDKVSAVDVSLPDGTTWTVPNAPGKAASARIYAYLSSKHHGVLDSGAAQEGLKLYAEVAAEAQEHPGSHPNIDLLFKVLYEDWDCTITVHHQQ